MAGRLALIKSIIESSFIHSFWIYKWPGNLIKELNGCIRNFLWTGSITKRKLVIVAWIKVCKPFDKGGLGLRDLRINNSIFFKKFIWDVISTDSLVSSFLRSGYFSSRLSLRKCGIFSSIWPGLKSLFSNLMLDSCWVTGDNSKIQFWTENWLGYSILDNIVIDDSVRDRLRATISDFRNDNSFYVPKILIDNYPDICNDISKYVIAEGEPDRIIWKKSLDGFVSCKKLYDSEISSARDISWGKFI